MLTTSGLLLIILDRFLDELGLNGLDGQFDCQFDYQFTGAEIEADLSWGRD